MIVEQIMTKEVITLSPTDTIKSALQLMQTENIRHLPLINNERQVIGLVTERDIKDAAPSILFEEQLNKQLDMTLSSIMTTNIITSHPHDFVEEVAVLILQS